jgi:hypothetical protein
MEKGKSMLAVFLVSIGMIFLTVFITIQSMNTAAYVWQNAHSMEDVFPLIGDYTIICLYGFILWLVKFAGIGIATIVFSYILIHELGLWLEKYKTRRMSPIYTETSIEGGEKGGSTPTPIPKQLDPDEVGEAVRDYIEANKSKFKKLRFSPYESGIMDEIYEAIGRPAVTGNKQDYNLKFGKFLLSSKYFEADGNHIKLNPLYTKEVEFAAKDFEKRNANSESADLIHEVKKEYGSDKNRTLVGQN